MLFYNYTMDFLYDKIPYIFALGGIFAMGLLFSCTVVGHVLHEDEITKKVLSIEAEAEMEKRLKQKEYEGSFYKELESLENIDLTKTDMDKLAKLYITEDTPSGKIKICYSCETETFWYYSKNKNISYPTLDAVARRYAVKHNCSQICINYRKEVEKINNAAVKKSTEGLDEDESKEDTPSIYVKLKSYNKVAKKTKKLVTVERSNRFTYKGDIVEDEDREQREPIQKISFAEYKKRLENEKIKTQ